MADPGFPPFLENGAEVDRERARVAILPVPFEGTVSYGRGASRGPAALLAASEQLELYDERLRCEPGACGVRTDPPVVVDGADPAPVVAEVERRVGALLDDDRWPLVLGGEHSITPGAVAAAVARHQTLRVVQLDAHADLRDVYQGSPASHACAMARCLERAPVHALGVRSYSREEAERIESGADDYRIAHAWELDDAAVVDRALAGLDRAPVWLTIDVDVLDPSVMPATGTPEPGGPDWNGLIRLLDAIFSRARVIGADLVELAPIDGLHHPEFTAARLAHTVVGLAFGGRAR